uniref:Uncharacterized protein n=1 Tax=Syphacia muris TaxID=451379 RepID=A0A0N5ANG2_9BILA
MKMLGRIYFSLLYLMLIIKMTLLKLPLWLTKLSIMF